MKSIKKISPLKISIGRIPKSKQSDTSETGCTTGTSLSTECLSNENSSLASPKKVPVLRISKKRLEILEPRHISSSKVPNSLPMVNKSLSAKNTPSKYAIVEQNPQDIEYVGFMNVHEGPNDERNKYQRLLTTLTFSLAKEIKNKNKWVSSNEIDCIMRKLAFQKERSDVNYFFTNEFHKPRGSIKYEEGKKFIQIQGTHGGEVHWIVFSNCGNDADMLTIYDSKMGYPSVKKNRSSGIQTCRSLKNNSDTIARTCDLLKNEFGIKNVKLPVMHHQNDDYTCGIWAIIYATCLWKNINPEQYDVSFQESYLRGRWSDFLMGEIGHDIFLQQTGVTLTPREGEVEYQTFPIDFFTD